MTVCVCLFAMLGKSVTSRSLKIWMKIVQIRYTWGKVKMKISYILNYCFMFIIFECEMSIGNYKHDWRLAISGKASSGMCKYKINCRCIHDMSWVYLQFFHWEKIAKKIELHSTLPNWIILNFDYLIDGNYFFF